jgi:hypothetical protein
MRAIGRNPVRLFFINGMVPTDAERKEAESIGAGVRFRNALLVDNDGGSALEECDSVHGAVPPRYKLAFPDASTDGVTGVGGLRTVHDGEPGVTLNQPLHLDSRPTGDPIEEERRRASRGEPVNSDVAEKAVPGRLDPNAGWGLPFGIPGAAQLTAGEVSQIRSEQQGAAGSADPVNVPVGGGTGGGDANATAIDTSGSADGSAKSADKKSK